VKFSCRSPTPTIRWVSQNVSYDARDTLAQMIAASVPTRRSRASIRL
jgi:hypothetical protein